MNIKKVYRNFIKSIDSYLYLNKLTLNRVYCG